MAKVVSRYKGKVYVNEANYSAGLLMADVWKETCDYKIGDIFRIVHRGKKVENRIHLERVPIQDSINVINLWMYKEGKFVGSYAYSMPISPVLNLIEERFGHRPFLARTFTSSVTKSQDGEIKKIMESFDVDSWRKAFVGAEALKKLVNRGYMEEKREKNLIFYRLLEEPIVEKALHHLHSQRIRGFEC